MKQILSTFGGILIGLALSLPVFSATELEGLYEASVPVFSQGSEERTQAIRRAFNEVVIRVSGNRNAVTVLEFSKAAENVVPYVQQYRYDKISSEQNQTAVRDPRAEQLLWVRFDEAIVNRILQQNNLAVWNNVRPVMLVWLAVEDAGLRFIVDSGSASNIPKQFEKVARQRGLPVVFPLMDLEDQQKIRVTDVWGNFHETIASASERYQAEAIIVGQLLHEPSGGWRARWSFYGEKNTTGIHWGNIASDQETLIRNGLDAAADRLAQRYAHMLSELKTGNVLLTISDVDSLESYAGVQKYLETLPSVVEAHLMRVENGRVDYELVLKTGVNDLLQMIRLGKTLIPIENLNPVSPVSETKAVDSSQQVVANRFFYKFVH